MFPHLSPQFKYTHFHSNQSPFFSFLSCVQQKHNKKKTNKTCSDEKDGAADRFFSADSLIYCCCGRNSNKVTRKICGHMCIRLKMWHIVGLNWTFQSGLVLQCCSFVCLCAWLFDVRLHVYLFFCLLVCLFCLFAFHSFYNNFQEPPDMKTINDQRDMIMKLADRDGDDAVQKKELVLLFSVAKSRKVQDIKVGRTWSRRSISTKQVKKQDDTGFPPTKLAYQSLYDPTDQSTTNNNSHLFSW